MMKSVDYGLSAVPIGVGALHSFIVAPQVYDALTPDAFWFFLAGLAVIFTGLLNVLRVAHGGAAPALRWAALFASLSLLATIAAFAVTQDAAADPVVLIQIAAYAALSVMALRPTRRG